MKIMVLNGPNLNMLGTREPSVYGAATLAEINDGLTALAGSLGVALEFFQSNHEGALLDKIQESCGGVDGFIINPGGLTHTSVVLRDALAGAGKPFVEVHISNVHAREEFRRRSLLSEIAAGVVFGFGPVGYQLALRGLTEKLKGRAV